MFNLLFVFLSGMVQRVSLFQVYLIGIKKIIKIIVMKYLNVSYFEDVRLVLVFGLMSKL